MQVVRSKLFDLLLVVWTALFGIPIITYFALREDPKTARYFSRQWSRGFLVLCKYVLGLDYRLENADLLPDGPVIVVSNHQSQWETIAFLTLFPDSNIIAKGELFSIPVFGWYLKNSPMMKVDRDQPGASIRAIIKETRVSRAQGRSIVIFPEGTRVSVSGRRGFERGLEAIQRAGSMPIVPVTLNSGVFWASGARIKHPGRITVRIHPPITADDAAYHDLDGLEGYMNDAKDAMVRDLGTAG